jgi:hypothetical protein
MKHPLHNSILKQRSHYIVLYCIGGRQAYFLSQNLFIKRVLNIIVGGFLASFSKVVDFWFRSNKKKAG